MAKYAKNTARSTVLLLWSIVFAKCFALEYLVRAYGIKVNTLFYIWFLSIGMATAASILHAKITFSPDLLRARLKTSALILVAALTVFVLIIRLFLHSEPAGLMAIAWSLTMLHLARSLNRKNRKHLTSAVGWFCGGAILFWTGEPGAWGVFSVCILCFTTAPALSRHIVQRRRARTAMPLPPV